MQSPTLFSYLSIHQVYSLCLHKRCLWNHSMQLYVTTLNTYTHVFHNNITVSIEENAECSCSKGDVGRNCYPPGVTEGLECSGRGNCMCGQCICSPNPDPLFPTKVIDNGKIMRLNICLCTFEKNLFWLVLYGETITRQDQLLIFKLCSICFLWIKRNQ